MLVGSPSSARPRGAVGGAPDEGHTGSTTRSQDNFPTKGETPDLSVCTDDYTHKDACGPDGWPASEGESSSEVTGEEGGVHATTLASHSSCRGSKSFSQSSSDERMSASSTPSSCEGSCSADRSDSASTPVAAPEYPVGHQLKEAVPAPECLSGDSVRPRRPLRFFIGGLPQQAEDQDLYELFSKYGSVLDVRIAKDYATGRKRGFAFVTMKAEGSKDTVFEKVQYIGGKRVDIRRENDITPTDLLRKVFVGGLHPSWAQEDLSRELSRFGEVETVQIATDENGNSRCFGFVTFKQEQVAESLIGQGSCKIGDRFVEIRKPEPKRSRAKSDGWRNHWQGGYQFLNESLWYSYFQQQWQAYYAGFHYHPDLVNCWSYWPRLQNQVPSNPLNMNVWVLAATVLLRECGFGHAVRIPAREEDLSVYRVLGHPAVGPLSSLAGLIEVLEAAKPCLITAAGEDEVALSSMQALTKRLKMLKPIIRNVLLVISKPTTTGEAEDEEAILLRNSAARVLTSISQVFTCLLLTPLSYCLITAQLSAHVADFVPKEPDSCLGFRGLDVVRAMAAAKAHAAALHASAQFPKRRGSRVAERFIIHVFIPHSEKLFAMSERLKEFSASQAKSRSAASLASLQEAWRHVHDSVLAAGAALFRTVEAARQSIAGRDTESEARGLTALASYSEKSFAASAPFFKQRIDAQHVEQRLDSLKKALAKYRHHSSFNCLKSTDEEAPSSLVEAVKLAVEVETILPHLQYLNADLQSAKNKLRVHTARFQAHAESVNGGIEANNRLRRQINSLRTDVEHLLRHVRSRASAALRLQVARAATEQLDMMDPLHRFQQLVEVIHIEGRSQRFYADLHRLRSLLRKLHREAERLHDNTDS
ncbi:hypothetical protein Esti_000832 [Eimeria stiedai]